MRILWFSNTASVFDTGSHPYHGCGWIEALALLLVNKKGIELGVAFMHSLAKKKEVDKNITFYPVLKKRCSNPLKKLVGNWRGEIGAGNIQKDVEWVVSDFKPDIIQVFGTEGYFCEIQQYIDLPVVFHIQGLLNPCLNAYFPPGQSRYNFIFNQDFLWKNLKGNSPVFDYMRFRGQALREKKVLSNAKYAMGRTPWDKMLVKNYNPRVKYFHVSEVLRAPFYENQAVACKEKAEILIVSTLSPTIYKGIDVVLKVAAILSQDPQIKFRWKLIGVDANDLLFRHFRKSLGLLHKEIGVECVGRQTAAEIATVLVKSDLYVHPTYIDNSPNSLCEAQLLGLPVIASNVGGVPFLISHQESGVLVPANGVYEIAACVKDFFYCREVFEEMARKGRQTALARHHQETIVADLCAAYKEIMGMQHRLSYC